MGAAAALRERIGAAAPLLVDGLGDVDASARKAMGDEEFEKALAEGRRMTLEEVVEYAASLPDG